VGSRSSPQRQGRLVGDSEIMVHGPSTLTDGGEPFKAQSAWLAVRSVRCRFRARPGMVVLSRWYIDTENGPCWSAFETCSAL